MRPIVRRLIKIRPLPFTISLALFLLVTGQVYLRLGRTSKSLGPPPNDGDPNAPSSVCHSPRCIAAFEAVAGRAKRVPSIRHILWKSDQVSRYFADQLKTWHDVHPDWKFVLWRDADLDRFVARHYPGVLGKFRSLPHFIMRVDMVRYMILHHFGGVYADLDYTLVRPLDRFLKFPAIVTRESEAHSLFHFGMRDWPPPLLTNPAFLMSEPRHPFFQFCIAQLACRPVDSSEHNYMTFAGPLGLSDLLLRFASAFPVAASPELAVFVPASRSFYPYRDNNLNTSTSVHQKSIRDALQGMCGGLLRASTANLTAFCANVLVLDPVTDPREPVFAVHDNQKARSSYDERGSAEFSDHPVDIRSVLPGVVMADTLF